MANAQNGVQNGAHDGVQNDDIDGSQLQAIIYLDEHRRPLLFPLKPNLPPSRVYPENGTPGPLRLCSSSCGFALYLDNEDRLFDVVNPFIPPGEPGHKEIKPDQFYIRDAPAVISLDLSPCYNDDPDYRDDPIIYISYPVHRVDNEYRFFSCTTGDDNFHALWCAERESFPVVGHIISETAVSCGVMAFWLTSARKLISYDPTGGTRRPIRPILDLPDFGIINPQVDEKMQLGVVGNRLGLVLANMESIALFLLNEGMNGWEPNPFAQLPVENIAPYTNGWNGTSVNTDRIVCSEPPQPLRFESSRMEVPLLIDRKLCLWEKMSDESTRVTLIRNILEDGFYYQGAVPMVRSNIEIS